MMFVAMILSLSGLVSGASEEDGPVQALWQAAKGGDVARIQELLDQGVDPDATTEFKATALYFAATNNHPEACRLLVKAGASMEIAETAYGNTPLGSAAWFGRREAVEVLVELGAKGAQGAMFGAASAGRLEVLKYLMEALEPSPPILSQVWLTAKSAGQDRVANFLTEVGVKEVPIDRAAPPPTPKDQARQSKKWTDEADRPQQVSQGKNWSSFRGEGAMGIGDGQGAPFTWDVPGEKNVLWKTDVPGLGHSSPVTFDDRIFITTAIPEAGRGSIEQGEQGWINSVDDFEVEHRFQVLCYALNTGELLWKREVKKSAPLARRHWKASYANPSVAVDQEVVIASFGSDGLFAFDLEGEALWTRDLGLIQSGWFVNDSYEWGYSSSPVLFDGQVIVQCDGAPQCFLAAFDALTGEELWRTERDEISSFASPNVLEGEQGYELVTNAPRAIRGYDPWSGEELWTLSPNSNITIATPISDGEHIYVVNGYQTPQPIYAIRFGARGDISLEGGESSNESIAWSSMRGGTYEPVPLCYRGRLYLLGSQGILACHDAKSGERLYRQRVDSMMQVTSSPVAADGKLYVTSEDGRVFVIRAGDEYELMAENVLGDDCLTTPAMTQGKMIFRTLSQLIALGHS